VFFQYQLQLPMSLVAFDPVLSMSLDHGSNLRSDHLRSPGSATSSKVGIQDTPLTVK